MGLWDTFRTAWKLAQKVAEIDGKQRETDQRLDELQSEWTDVLDKLKAREERQRKRDQRAIKRGLVEEDNGGDPHHPVAAGPDAPFDKDAARAIARSRGLIR